MNLYITLNTMDYNLIPEDESIIYPETLSIAGKEIIQYWLEWARYKGFKKLYIYTKSKHLDKEKILMLEALYNIDIIYYDSTNSISHTKKSYMGLGIFLDNGEYRMIKNLDDFLQLEEVILFKSLNYSSSIGYGEYAHMEIGKNVYIHKSVKLSGVVVIGDNCIIEKDVEIKNSVINNNCVIKRDSIIENSHIGTNIYFTTNLYLKDKALFQSIIYNKIKKTSVSHKGICLKN